MLLFLDKSIPGTAALVSRFAPYSECTLMRCGNRHVHVNSGWLPVYISDTASLHIPSATIVLRRNIEA
jgi:hypothetical protein